MKINKVTITGADDKIFKKDLIGYQTEYPFVEWGILFSKNKESTQRYPSLQHITNEYDSDLKLSAHFCGWYSKEVLENKNYKLIEKLKNRFERVQLNYNFKNSTNWDLNSLIDFLKDYNKIDVILQYNKSNSLVLQNIMNDELPNNLNFLYDSSGGRGTEISKIESPFKNYTGYSGGLNVDNINNICQNISNDSNTDNVWIDLESGVRTNNDFDFNKLKTILEISKKYI